MKQTPKKRFSVGRRVLVGMGMRPGIVTSVAEQPSVMGEFVHLVQVDGEQEARAVLGCDIQALPGLDEDLQGMNRPTVHLHIQNSNIANLNLGSQLGTINAALESISGQGSAQQEFVQALKQLTEAVVSQKGLPDREKQEIVQALSTIAEQATKKPEERSKGTLKAVVSWLPTAIAAASDLTTLWGKFGPIIRRYLGI